MTDTKPPVLRTSHLDRVLAKAQANEAAAAEAKLSQEKQRQLDRDVTAAREAQQQQQTAVAQLRFAVRKVAEELDFRLAKAAEQKLWKTSAIEEATAYALKLLCHEEHDLPKIDPGIAKVVQDKFAYAVFRYGDNIPADYFVGQRQEWFAPLLKTIKAQAPKPKPKSSKPAGQSKSTSKVMYSTHS